MSAPSSPSNGTASISTNELLQLVYASQTNDDFTDVLDFSALGSNPFKNIMQAILDLGETLTREEREAFERGEPEKIRSILKRIRNAYINKNPKDQLSTDRLTQLKAHVQHERTLEYLPLNEDTGSSAQQTTTDAARLLKAGKRELTAIMHHNDASQSQKDDTLFRSGIPKQGFSGAAHALPVQQLFEHPLSKTVRALGIHNLAEFLASAAMPQGRSILSQRLGVPVHVLLLAAWRAELLDLSIQKGTGRQPHLKDILLLARLGLGRMQSLGQLAAAFKRRPVRMNLLGELIALLQKAQPHSIGKQPITRHDLRAWATAASKQGSHVLVSSAHGTDKNNQSGPNTAESIIDWYLNQQCQSTEDRWDDVVSRMIVELKRAGIALDNSTWQQLLLESDSERLLGYIQLMERKIDSSEHSRINTEMQRYETYLTESNEATLLSNLAPWVRPDMTQHSRMICFYMDPVPEARHAIGDTNTTTAQSLKTVHICIDPDSGSIFPFGAC